MKSKYINAKELKKKKERKKFSSSEDCASTVPNKFLK